jgi:hypothetical protein
MINQEIPLIYTYFLMLTRKNGIKVSTVAARRLRRWFLKRKQVILLRHIIVQQIVDCFLVVVPQAVRHHIARQIALDAVVVDGRPRNAEDAQKSSFSSLTDKTNHIYLYLINNMIDTFIQGVNECHESVMDFTQRMDSHVT